jgi:putative transposase
MPDYRRWRQPGGTYFFTVVTYGRRPIFDSDVARRLLRQAFLEALAIQPFVVDAIVVLPDHLHALWTLPSGDEDFSTRWGTIKKHFSSRWIASGGSSGVVSASKSRDRRVGVWQRRFWEHWIRSDDDFARHLDYIHFNPVRHGYVERPKDWPYSSFRKWVARGAYSGEWCDESGKCNDEDFQQTTGE